MMKKELKVIPVSKIFKKTFYEIPIYQRSYAWREDQINQLLDDIDTEINLQSSRDETYFFGNLIVNENDDRVYEVIDGQQRLTTLFLLQCYLFDKKPSKGSLTFETRNKSNQTLKFIAADKDIDDEKANSLTDGYGIIEKYFMKQGINKADFIKKLDKVKLIRIQVPKKIDLNHYFEVMNTRGEQLELHEIVKSRLLSVMSDPLDRKIAAEIWGKCAKLDSYIQMNFSVEKRNQIFDKEWDNLNEKIINFDSLKAYYSKDHSVQKSHTLLEILNDKHKVSEVKPEELESDRFESIIFFPNFLLQVEAASKMKDADESNLNDNNLLENLKSNWSSEAAAKNFIFMLLKCRVIFDRFILKREFTADFKESGRWSLQKLKRYGSQINYINTFSDDNLNRQILMLEAVFRITYTSPKTMGWISEVMRNELAGEEDLLTVLEKHAREKVIKSDFTNKSGFGIERIVFTYLDYLLFRDGYSYQGEQIIPVRPADWYFQFRSSIEHFYPQKPTEIEPFDEKILNNFGNLALITVSGNSTFNNATPIGKATTNPNIIKQSLKLEIMAQMTKDNRDIWDKEMIENHQKEMFKLLENDIGSNDINK